MRCCESASCSVNDFDSRTALSAASMLRPRLEATERIRAAASFSIFCFIVSSGRLHGSDESNWMCGSGGRSGCHGGDIGRLENEDPRRTGVTAGRRHVDDDGHGRGGNLFDDLPGGTDQAARRIHLDQYGLSVAAAGFVDGAGNVLLADRLNCVVDDDFQHLG